MPRVMLVEDNVNQMDSFGRWIEEQWGDVKVDIMDSLREIRDAATVGNAFPYDCAIVDVSIYEKKREDRVLEPPDIAHGIAGLRELLVVLPKEKLLVITAWLPDVQGPVHGLGLANRLRPKGPGLHKDVFIQEVGAMLGR